MQIADAMRTEDGAAHTRLGLALQVLRRENVEK